MVRQPILSVLGHVDHGKTSLLDMIRESRIVEGEEGGITQMIGATEVPIDTVEEVCGGLLESLDTDLEIPGLLFIDTPGHAAFSSLRKRGGSISDIAILVIDIEEGVQPQTEEAIQILKRTETPFIVAFNKIDRLNGWKSEKECFLENLDCQPKKIREELDEKVYDLMGQMHDYGVTVDRFDRVDNFQEKVAVVPISAKTGEGIPELLMVVAGLAQNYLGDRLEVHEDMGRGTVLEVTDREGLGKTVDVIHYDGKMSNDQVLVYGSVEGVEETDVRSLMQPRPLNEIRLDDRYERVEECSPASGVKISGKNLEGVMSGSPVRTVDEERVEEAREEVEEEMDSFSIDTSRKGIIVKADSLGSLEAVLEEFKDQDINVSRARVGDVTKRDVVEAENQEGVDRALVIFNVGIDGEAWDEFKDSEEVEIFQSDVIYELKDSYTEWMQEVNEDKRMKALEAVKRPAKLRILEDHVFRQSSPAVVGVKVVEGVLNPGSMLMNQEGEKVGRLKSVQEENESVEEAVKGDQVAVSVSNATVGRDFKEGEVLYTDTGSDNYRRLRQLEDLLGQGELNVLDQIVDIKDGVDPHWKI